MKRALITGITGQAGSYLTELLLEKGYEVHGIIRRASNFNTQRIDHLYKDPHNQTRLLLHYGDILDPHSIELALKKSNPDEVFHLSCQSHVKVSFDQPIYTSQTVAIGTLNLLESVRRFNKDIRIYNSSSSEMFGSSPPCQNEETPFRPRSPYAVAKVAAHLYCINYREAYDMFVANGILFNFESPRRGETFVTRKITRAIGRIHAGLQHKLYLGNLQAKRDWNYAKDSVEAMWLMLQQNKPDDFVIASGRTHSVQEFLELAFSYIDKDWREYVEIDQKYFRPTEVDILQGDPRKARKILGWKPRTIFKNLVKMMVEHDKIIADQEYLILSSGKSGICP